MRFSLKHKIFIFGLLLILATLGAVGTLGYKYGKVLEEDLNEVNANIAHKDIDDITLSVYEVCRTTHEIFQSELEYALHLFLCFSRGETPATLNWTQSDFKQDLVSGAVGSKEQSWRPGHQTNLLHSLPEVSLPSLKIEERSFGADTPGDHAFFDKIRLIRNVEMSVFQRINITGDMLRIATTLLDKSGKSAEGTYMPAFLNETEPNPIISSVLAQRAYDGRFLIFDSWYIAFYKPILSDEGEVIGMLFMGMKTNALKIVEDFTKRINIGKRGRIWLVYSGSKPHTGEPATSLISDDSSEIKPYDYCDSLGVYFMREICSEAIKLEPTVIKTRITRLSSGVPDEPKRVLTHYTYFEPWDAVIGVEVEGNAALYDHSGMQKAFHTFFEKLTRTLGFLGLGFVAFIYLLLGRFLAHVHWLPRVCSEFSKKPLKHCLQVFTPNITEEIKFSAFYDEVNDSLAQLQRLGQILEKNGQFLDFTKKEIQSIHDTLASNCNRQQVFLKTLQTANAALLGYIKSIGNQSGQVTRSVVNFYEKLSNISKSMEIKELSAGEIRSILENLTNSISTLESRLSGIFEKANKLNRVITTINKIASQANLLSFNTTIEADRGLVSGVEQGITSEQIASFANKTSIFSIDTEQVINETQLSISTGIKEIDTFLKKIRKDLGRINAISLEQESFIKPLQATAKQFFEIKNQITYQASQITSMVEEGNQLNHPVMQSLSLIEDFYAVNEKVRQIQIRIEEQHNNF